MYPLILIMKYLSAEQILEQYKRGRRDFSNVNAHGAEIIEKKLPGIIFRKANLNTGSLRGCDLTGADFTAAKMKWMDLDNCNFTNAILSKADLSFSKFRNSIFRDTRVDNANFTYTLMFGVNRGGANFGNAIMNKIAWKTDTTYLGGIEIEEAAKKTGMRLDIFIGIKQVINDLRINLQNFGYKISKYYKPSYNIEKPYVKQESAYGKKETIYSAKSEYIKKRKYGEKL